MESDTETRNAAISGSKGLAILVIDDDPASLALVTKLLAAPRCTILAAEDGESGVRRAAYAHPDLILLDILMPGIDGYETCRRLKASDDTKDIPVIFMTAVAETDHKIKGFEAGAVDYVTKPFQQEELLARVGVHLHIRELARRLREANESLEVRVAQRTNEFETANRELQAEILVRKQTEEALRESEKMFRTLVENLPVKVFIKDRKSVYVSCNPGYALDLAIKPEQIRGKTDYDFYPEELAGRYRADDRRIMEAAKGEELEEEYLTGEQRLWIHTIKTPLVDESHDVTGVMGVFWDVTERKKADQALRDSEELYRTLVSLSPDAISVADMNSLLTFTSPKTMQMFGDSPDDEILGRSVLSWVAPEEQENTSTNMRRLLAGETLPATEFTMVKKDGTRFIGETNAAVIRSPDGNPTGMIIIIRDVTERKLAENALRESEEKFRTLVENAPDAIFIQMEGRFAYLNDAVVRLYGATSEKELLGHATVERIHPDCRAKVLELIRFIDEEGKHIPLMELKHVKLDGTTVYVESHAVPIRYQESKGILVFVRDITERKKVDESLILNEERYSRLFEDASLGIFRVTLEGKLINVNPAYARMFGFDSPEEIKSQVNDLTVDLYVDPSHGNEIGRMIMDAKHPVHIENLCRRRKDGTIFTADLHAWAVHGRDDNFLYIEGFIEDISERKRAEEERRRLGDRLQRAEKMEALGTLAGGVAHDLNNVLGIVVGYSELLANDSRESGSARSKAMEILKGGQRAAAIVQDLLTLARRGVPNRKVLNLNSIVLECQNSPEFAGISSYHPNIRIETDLEADLLNISGSAVHLSKSLMNLVSNAAEAMPQGGVIAIKTGNQYLDKPVSGYGEVREGDYVVLSLSDTGEGIPAKDMKRIFEPFYTKKVMGRSGTGLGLAVIWGTVKDHHGYINVESEERRGTTFTLYFPVTKEDLSPEEVAASAAEYMGNDESILIVDDVKEQRELAGMMLKKLNYNVISVAGGEEAIEYLKQHRVDLVVLDMIMDPGMDGLDTYAKILESHPHQRAIIVSGFSETERVSKAQALGVGTYVKKPYILEKLGLAVRKELDRPG